MTDFEFEQKMKSALARHWDERLSDSAEEPAHCFSAKFERGMARLLRRQKNPPRSLTHSLGRRLALVALVLCIVATSLVSVSAIRMAVLKFFAEVEITHTRFTMVDENGAAPTDTEITQYYVPGYLPEGFSLDSEETLNSFAVYIYLNGDIELTVMQLLSTVALYANTEGTTTEEITVNGISYIYYENHGLGNLLWYQHGYAFICSGDLPQAELLKVAEGLKKIN